MKSRFKTKQGVSGVFKVLHLVCEGVSVSRGFEMEKIPAAEAKVVRSVRISAADLETRVELKEVVLPRLRDVEVLHGASGLVAQRPAELHSGLHHVREFVVRHLFPEVAPRIDAF